MRGFIVVPLTLHYQYSNLSTIKPGIHSPVPVAQFRLPAPIGRFRCCYIKSQVTTRRTKQCGTCSATRSYIVRNDEKLSACLS